MRATGRPSMSIVSDPVMMRPPWVVASPMQAIDVIGFSRNRQSGRTIPEDVVEAACKQFMLMLGNLALNMYRLQLLAPHCARFETNL
jgi:hypothetical protein